MSFQVGPLSGTGICPHGSSSGACPMCMNMTGRGTTARKVLETRPEEETFTARQALQKTQNLQQEQQQKWLKETASNPFQHPQIMENQLLQTFAQTVGKRFDSVASSNVLTSKEIRLEILRLKDNHLASLAYLSSLMMFLQTFRQEMAQKMAEAWSRAFLSPIEAILAIMASLIAYLALLKEALKKESMEWQKRWLKSLNQNKNQNPFQIKVKSFFKKITTALERVEP